MPAYTDITGLSGIAIALASSLLAIPGFRGLTRTRQAALIAAVIALVLAPLGPLSLAACVRGATGDLSVTTLVLLIGALLRGLTGWPPRDSGARFALLAYISVAALGLYPLALGLASFDPYRLGYGSPWLVGSLFAAALAAWWGRLYIITTCLALATLAWSVRWYESSNLWDYLLDPLISFYALGFLAIRGTNRAWRSLQVRNAEPR